MTDHDIHAFGAPPVAPARPQASSTAFAPRRRWWLWLLGGLLLFTLLVLTALTLAVAGLADGAQHGWQVVINGHEWDGLDIDALGSVIGLLTAALVVVIIVVLVVPAVLLLALLTAGGGVGLALAVVLLALALVAAIMLSPLWLLWLLLHRRSAPSRPRAVDPEAAGARMNA
jgi:hypothetical protein